jgi:hypothetical protein
MTPEEAPAEFARCRPWIEAAIDRAEGTLTIDDVIHAIAEGRMHFWPGKNCAAVTELAVFPRKRILNVTLAGGDMDEILDMIPSFKAFGRALGCECVAVVGREGWERVLGRLGWKKAHVVLTTPTKEAGESGQFTI